MSARRPHRSSSRSHRLATAPSPLRPARAPTIGARRHVAYVVVLTLLSATVALYLAGCCSCGSAGAAGAATDAALDEGGARDYPREPEELRYYWYGELPVCPYVAMGQVEVAAPAWTPGMTDEQAMREVELGLGRAAIEFALPTEEDSVDSWDDARSGTRVLDVPGGFEHADGVFGIQRSKGNLYVGTAFAFKEPGCRN